MKHLVIYKSRIDGKKRKEVFNTLNDLVNFLLKINYYTDESETVTITSYKPLTK